MSIVIRPIRDADIDAVTRIYNHYVRETVITFEEQEIAAEVMARRVAEVVAPGLPWLVADDGRQVAGYAYAGKWKERSAYRFSVESTVYLDPTRTGAGIGAALYRDLLSTLQAQSIRAVIGGIALPNAASVALHEKLGFEKAAHFREVGYKFGRWIDVGYWQRVL